jgi:hypothetical protein
MSGDPLRTMRYTLRQTKAADGSVLHDVIDNSAPAAPTLYRSPDRAHAQSVADDLARGALDPAAVQSIFVELIAAGWHRPLGDPFAWRPPWPWQKREETGTVWQQAAQRIEALRTR